MDIARFLNTLTPFRPRLLATLKSYSGDRFAKDLGAGLTVAIVALPLAMAFAIASGLKPEAGLWTAIIGGFLVSALGGSTVQIGGPAGAFIVIVYGIVERYGLANLWISTACAGVILFAMGLFGLGRLVRFVPVSIVIGFTNGIAVLIALSQVKDWLGLHIGKMPADFFSQVKLIAQHADTLNPFAFALGSVCVVGLIVWPRLFAANSRFRDFFGKSAAANVPGMQHAFKGTSQLPGPIVALVTLTLLAWALQLPVETIGSRFGGIPQSLPVFALPDFSWETVKLLVTPTLTIALLGAVESLLCARVADQLSGASQPSHDPNQELMAQGVANVVVPFFGGMPVTGTVARTVTNLRAGATSPVAGVVHALALAGVVLLAAPLALHVPLAVLAGILLFVAWNMGAWHEFARLRQFSNHYRLMMLGTFGVTVVFDLTLALEIGMVLACVLFVRRMSALFQVNEVSRDGGTAVYRLYGALFFGAVAQLDPLVKVIEQGDAHPTLLLDCARLIALDTTGLDALANVLNAVTQRGGTLRLIHLTAQPLSLVERSGFAEKLKAQSGWT